MVGAAIALSAKRHEPVAGRPGCARVDDPGAAARALGDGQVLQRALAGADLAAATLRSGKAHDKANLLERLVKRVRVGEEDVSIELDAAKLQEKLELPASVADKGDSLILCAPTARVRRGHQLRLVVPGREAGEEKPPRRDPKLLALLAEALQARELLHENPASSLLALASAHGRCRTRIAKLAALSCLAPDIVKRIRQLAISHLSAIEIVSQGGTIWSSQLIIHRWPRKIARTHFGETDEGDAVATRSNPAGNVCPYGQDNDYEN